MISTKYMNIDLAKRKRLERVTTKDIDASIKVTKPKEESRMKSPLISTHNIGSIEEVEDRKERAEILAQRKSFKKDDPVYLNKDGVLVPNEKEEKTIKEQYGSRTAKEIAQQLNRKETSVFAKAARLGLTLPRPSLYTPEEETIIRDQFGSRTLKEIGKQARLDLEKMFGCKIFISLWVKVKEGWVDDKRSLAELGI